jgi:hypothetical protein
MPAAAGPGQGRARQASRRLSQGVEGVERTLAQLAVAHRAEKGTATTNTADTPERFKQLAAGCARLLICSSS